MMRGLSADTSGAIKVRARRVFQTSHPIAYSWKSSPRFRESGEADVRAARPESAAFVPVGARHANR